MLHSPRRVHNCTCWFADHIFLPNTFIYEYMGVEFWSIVHRGLTYGWIRSKNRLNIFVLTADAEKTPLWDKDTCGYSLLTHRMWPFLAWGYLKYQGSLFTHRMWWCLAQAYPGYQGSIIWSKQWAVTMGFRELGQVLIKWCKVYGKLHHNASWTFGRVYIALTLNSNTKYLR